VKSAFRALRNRRSAKRLGLLGHLAKGGLWEGFLAGAEMASNLRRPLHFNVYCLLKRKSIHMCVQAFT
jgi:hypothetical protein